MELPSLRQLEYFLAVATHLNFREAARSCHVSQPALSAQVQQLEELLQLQLFERDNRHTLLTAAGEALVERARDIIVQTQDLVGSAHAFRAPLVGTLRLGVIPTIAPYLLPRVMHLAHERFPQLRLALQESMTERLLADLAAGRLDIALLALEADLGSVETLDLFTDPFHVVASRDHWIAERASIGEAELEGEQVLLLDDGHCLRDQVLTLCGSARGGACDDLRASSLSTLVQVVAGGIGVTFLPELAMSLERELGDSRKIVIRPFEPPVPSRTIGLAWRSSSSRRAEFELLGSLIQQAREELLLDVRTPTTTDAHSA